MPFHHWCRVKERKMTESRFAELLRIKEGRTISREAIESWRLLKMFNQLSPAQRLEVLELLEEYLRR
jgi:hypothetical protein